MGDQEGEGDRFLHRETTGQQVVIFPAGDDKSAEQWRATLSGFLSVLAAYVEIMFWLAIFLQILAATQAAEDPGPLSIGIDSPDLTVRGVSNSTTRRSVSRWH
jgi:hypothetical protein